MKSIHLLFLAVLQFFSVNCTIFLWSNKEIDIFPLQKFTDDDLSQLIGIMDNPKIMAYTNPNQKLPRIFKDLANDNFSAFNTNDDLSDVETIGKVVSVIDTSGAKSKIEGTAESLHISIIHHRLLKISEIIWCFHNFVFRIIFLTKCNEEVMCNGFHHTNKGIFLYLWVFISNIEAIFESNQGFFAIGMIGINYIVFIFTALTGDEESDFKKIKKDVDQAGKENENTLFFIISPSELRSKREIEDEEIVTSTPEPKGPVAYIGKSITDDKYGIIYSSTPLLLRINKTDLYLNGRENDLTSVDTVPRESITRLNVNILLADKRKIMLRFIFSWLDSYWFLTSVRISGTSYNTTYTLGIDKEVYAPERFSYHCSGGTVFSDTANDVYLYLTNMQVQIDSAKESFDDAYDCVPFTTVPIWSGIFVSSLLIVVLLLSLVALWDIKTMDKFDNYKTKQLTITVSE